jgi:O-antigen biosynthesis protein
MDRPMKVLWLSPIFPEPYSSAAGVRTCHLLSVLVDAGHDVHFWSTSDVQAARAGIAAMGVRPTTTEVNSSNFNTSLLLLNPDVVVFDRFMTEEQFSWRVKECCPQAVRILDTIDLHFLRRQRERAVRIADTGDQDGTLWPIPTEKRSEEACREVAAILRSDATLMVSEVERQLLVELYQVCPHLLHTLPLALAENAIQHTYCERKDFVFIGNVNHAPNYDAIKLLKTVLWPRIRKRVTEEFGASPELHIYGSYPKPDVLSLNNTSQGIFYKGSTPNAQDTLATYRVNLAPLRFGAGVKGKVLDGWAVGLPCAATNVAAEGLMQDGVFGGFVSDNWAQYIEQSCHLYCDEKVWCSQSEVGRLLLSRVHSPKPIASAFCDLLTSSIKNITSIREQNFIGSMLWHHSHKSTEYMSRWIEEKNRAIPSHS